MLKDIDAEQIVSTFSKSMSIFKDEEESRSKHEKWDIFEAVEVNNQVSETHHIIQSSDKYKWTDCLIHEQL